MPYTLTINSPIPPSEFINRSDIIKEVCRGLDDPRRISTCLVGGPKTGKTSILQYLASVYVSKRYTSPSKFFIAHLSGDSIGKTMKPSRFWTGVFKALRPNITLEILQSLLDKTLEKSEKDNIDVYDLEDLFDTFAKEDTPVLLLIDDFDIILGNESFSPPNDFFHIVRALGQREPRGLTFVITTSRPLIDLWEPTKSASPFYNIFQNIPIGRIKDGEIREVVREGFSKMGVQCDKNIEDLVINASERHPYLANYVASLCGDMLRKGSAINGSNLMEEFQKPDGPVVTLIRNIRRQLSIYEKDLLEMLKTTPHKVDELQKVHLLKLQDYGLLPPGVKVQ